MQRIILPAMITILTIGTASAGQLALNPESYAGSAVQAPGSAPLASIFAEPSSAQTAPAPQVRVAQRSNFGGGFLEMLFNPGGQQAPRQYEPTPYYGAQPEPNAGYESSRPMPHPAVSPQFMKQEISYDGHEPPGTV